MKIKFTVKGVIATILIIGLIIFGLITLRSLPSTACDKPVNVIYNNELMKFVGTNPIVYKDRVYLPLVNVAEMLDFQLIWNNCGKLNSILCTNLEGTNKVIIEVDSLEASINGVSCKLDSQPIDIDGRIFVPLRFVAEAFKKYVIWTDVTRIVNINDTNMKQQLF